MRFDLCDLEMTTYTIQPSRRKDKKLQLITPDNKVVHFGAAGMSDYTLHHDKDRRDRYLKRHQKEKDRWTMTKSNLTTPAFLSRHLLWEEKSLTSAAKKVENKLSVKLKISR